jgi:flagellar basal-body rod protein FlgF
MDKLIYTAMTGASQTMVRQAAVSHNLANVTSTGYRAAEHRLRAVPILSNALPTRAFVADASVSNDFTPGPMQQTGRVLDVAVQGPGWIALAMPDGSEAYTRNGSLEVSANGILQTRSGIPVQGDGGPVSIPPDNEITVAKDGTISVLQKSGARSNPSAVGRIKLVNPPEADLVRGSDGLFRQTNGQPAAADPAVALASGYLEGSNVNVVEQMVTMISLARQFEMQMRMLSNAEQNDRSATQVLAGL